MLKKLQNFLCLVLLSSCSEETLLQTEDGIPDPNESWNRIMMEAHLFLDDYILAPCATTYTALTPDLIQGCVKNISNTIKIPGYLINDLLQGNLEGFTQNGFVFLNNALTFGIIDVSGFMSVYANPNDFGKTLHLWGATPGISWTIPGLGITNTRDLTGTIVDTLLDPIGWIALNTNQSTVYYSVEAAGLLHCRATLLDQIARLRKNSYDFYSTVQSIIEQKREGELPKTSATP